MQLEQGVERVLVVRSKLKNRRCEKGREKGLLLRSWGAVGDFTSLARSAAEILAKAEFTGANTVKGPPVERVGTRLEAVTADTSVDRFDTL